MEAKQKGRADTQLREGWRKSGELKESFVTDVRSVWRDEQAEGNLRKEHEGIQKITQYS